MSDRETLLVSDPAAGVRVITLNRPEAHNAINLEMAERLAALLDEVEADQAVRCLIITGTGDQAFSAGFDIREMAGFDAQAMRVAFIKRDPLMLKIALLRVPVIAALNGLAHGAGALIAAACDFRVACPQAEFKVTAINYGSANATWSLPRLVGASRAKEILMTGRVVGADEGLRIGLFDRLAHRTSLNTEAIAFASEIASKDPSGITAVKLLVESSFHRSNGESWRAEHEQVLAALTNEDRSGREVFGKFLKSKEDFK